MWRILDKRERLGLYLNGGMMSMSSQLLDEYRSAEDPCVSSCHCLLRTGLSEHWVSLIFCLNITMN